MLTYRKSLYQVINWNVRPMSAMARTRLHSARRNSRCALGASPS
jgi:hypothetical protein